MALIPFWYQLEAINATVDYLFDTQGHPCLQIPTAGGKSLIQAEVARRVYDIAPDKQQIFLTDVTALIGQNRDELWEQWPDAKATLYSASYGSKNHNGELVFCGIQSVYKQAHLFEDVSVVYIDEVHRASLRDGGMYHQFFTKLWEKNPYARVVSLSATPWKLEYGTLAGSWLVSEIIYKIPMKTLFDEGFLCPILTPSTSIQLNFDGVKRKKSGEFDEKEMAALMDDEYVTEAAINDAMKYASDRKSGLIFACNVKHAEHIKESLEGHGEKAEIIIGETLTDDRKKIIDRFKNFELRWIISVGTLTTGFNAKNADLLIMLRATQSSSLWLQILGRVLRTHESKMNALVLDYGSNVSRFGPIDQIGPPPTKEQKKQAKRTPFKQCPGLMPSGYPCNTMVKYLDSICPKCAFEFGGESTPNHGTTASEGSLVQVKQDVKEIDVAGVTADKYKDKKGNECLRIGYRYGVQTVYEYLYFSGEPWQRIEACRWWEKRMDPQISMQCPRHADTALIELNQFGMKPVSKIYVDITKAKTTPSGGWIGHKVIGHE